MTTETYIYPAIGSIIREEDDAIYIQGRKKALTTSASLRIGQLKNWSGGLLMQPAFAWRSIRDRDTVIQIDEYGNVDLLNVIAGTTYTFNITIDLMKVRTEG